jgi:outer membrane murein-binding lipoprotein Lpp
MRLRCALAAAVLSAGVVAGCSNNASGSIDAAATRALLPLIHNIRVAAKHRSYLEVNNAINQFIKKVNEEQSAGNVSPTRANQIIDAADAFLSDFQPGTSTTTTPTTAETTTTTQSTTTTSTTTTTGPPTTTGGPTPTDSGVPSVAR